MLCRISAVLFGMSRIEGRCSDNASTSATNTQRSSQGPKDNDIATDISIELLFAQREDLESYHQRQLPELSWHDYLHSIALRTFGELRYGPEWVVCG